MSRERLATQRTALALALALVAGAASAQESISPEDAADHVGDEVTVCGRVLQVDFVRTMEGEPTFLVFGRPYPDHVFSVVIWGEDRAKFRRPERAYRNRDVCATGTVQVADDGRPRMAVDDPARIEVKKRDGGG